MIFLPFLEMLQKSKYKKNIFSIVGIWPFQSRITCIHVGYVIWVEKFESSIWPQGPYSRMLCANLIWLQIAECKKKSKSLFYFYYSIAITPPFFFLIRPWSFIWTSWIFNEFPFLGKKAETDPVVFIGGI